MRRAIGRFDDSASSLLSRSSAAFIINTAASSFRQAQVPTLLLHGEKDFACTLETQRYIQSLIPDSKLVVRQGAGHVPAMVRPIEVASEIDAFFAPRLK